MKRSLDIALLTLSAFLVNPVTAQTALQYGFDSSTGDVTVPINDDSGTGNHGTNLVHSTTAPIYSSDIPTNTQFVSGVGSIDFSGTIAGISTASSLGVGSGQGIISATDVFNAGGITMEIWIKNPSTTTNPGIAVSIGGMSVLGVTGDGNNIGFFRGDDSTVIDWTTTEFDGDEWNHLAVVLTTSDPAAENYSDISAYLNGELIHSAAHTFPWFLTRATSVGNHQYADWGNYNGLVYEPRISLGALSPEAFTFSTGPAIELIIESNGADLDFSWNSQEGKVYDLRNSIDPEADGDPATWPLVVGQEGIAADPATNTLTITRPEGSAPRFYVIREYDAPPLFFDNFDTDQGWTTGANVADTGTAVWARSAPAADGFGPDTDAGPGLTTNCFGTNTAALYGFNTDIYLRSPEIDLTAEGLTGATLTMAHFIDTDLAGDYGSIRVLRSSDLMQLGADVANNLEGVHGDNAVWPVSLFSEPLPQEALGEVIVLEFQFTADNGGGINYDGWYIDNVTVTVE